MADGDFKSIDKLFVHLTSHPPRSTSCRPFRPPSPEMNATPQTREHTYPPPPPNDATAATSASPPAGWAEYIKRLGKKDASVGVSRTWVKKGRDVDAKEDGERE